MFHSYRNQSVDLLSKSTDWFLYDGKLVVKSLTGELKTIANTLTGQSSTIILRSNQSYVAWGLREGRFFL